MLENIGGRKFLLTVLVLTILTIFVIIDKMTATQFITAVVVNLGIFSGANVVEKLKK